MRIKAVKYFLLLFALMLTVACAPIDPRSSILDVETRYTTQNNDEVNHEALAREYDDLAREIRAKIRKQEDLLEHKPSTSYFGKNGRNVKSHVSYKIREYEQIAQESAEKAVYHRELAAKMSQSNEKINKAKK